MMLAAGAIGWPVAWKRQARWSWWWMPRKRALLGRNGKKTDYRDCWALLKHLWAESLVVVWRPDAETRELRQLAREREALNQSIVHLKNRIQALLYEEGLQHPGERLWTDEGRKW